MAIRHSHHVKPWHLLALAGVSGVVCVFALRANNQHMAILRSQLYQVDQNGGNVQAALNKLQLYVVSHMNTDLATGNGVYPPIQLKGTYDRLVQAQGDALQKQQGQVYTDAQHYCEQQNSTDFSGRNRVPCIEQYVASHGVKLPAIPDSLYKYDFVSPRWSPDLAGWSMLATLLCLVVAAGLFLVRKFL